MSFRVRYHLDLGVRFQLLGVRKILKPDALTPETSHLLLSRAYPAWSSNFRVKRSSSTLPSDH